MVWHQLKRWLYLTHRWIGIFSCLFFAMWFASGLVMLYVPFPELSDSERVAGLAPIDWTKVEIGPRAAAATASPSLPSELVLEMRGDRPVWRVFDWDGGETTLLAQSGRHAGTVGEAEARHIAEQFGKAPVARIIRIDNDQWTVPGSYDRHRPLWKVSLAGDTGGILYVSSRTGAVVLDTSARERLWNWLGSIPHWLYPRALREHQPAWRQVVLWASAPCMIGAITGMWIGIIRLRAGRRRFKGGRMTPYCGWMKWHHVAGLVGGFFLIFWIFSGWLSVDPGRLFASGGVADEARITYAGRGPLPEPDLARLAAIAPQARRITLARAAGIDHLRIEQPGVADRLLDANSLAPLADREAWIRTAAAKLMPGSHIVAVKRLTASDAYWYAVHGPLPLPVLRIRYDDAAATWVHLDPRTGALLGGNDARGRLYRWLFDLLHRWDLNLLLAHAPSRELLIWLLSIAGLVTSVTGIYTGWVRLMRPARRGSARAAAARD